MNIFKDDAAQTSAEMLLLFGGVIVVVVIFALVYKNYLTGLGNTITGTDLQNVNNSINGLTQKFT
jgi:hypothetical protein